MVTISVLLLLLSAFSPPVHSSLTTFHIIWKDMNQTDARAACRENYIDLATVYSDKDNTELDYAMSTTPMGRINYGLIGLYRGQFSEKWSNGDPVTFSNLAGDCGTSSCCAAMKPDGSWESLQCNMTKYFMCYEQDASSQTPNYHLILESKTWYEAQRYCRGRYTDLVSIRDQQQNKEVKIKGLNSSTSFWTGLLRDDWQWTDGGNSAYRNWASGYPQSSPYDCVVMWQRTLNWYSVPCSDSHYPLCYSTFSRPVNSILTTFQYIQGYKIQTNARAACRGSYIDLATLYSDEDNTKLYNLTIGSGGGGRWPGWIGLYRGQFSEKWSNGDPVTFSNLAGDCGTSSCCAAMKPDGSWESLQCTGTRYFMCYEEDASSQTPNYHLILENKTWYGAQRYCRGRYTDLVSIRDQQQNELVKIKGLNSSTSFWIGLLRDDWQWTDGGNSAYRNWDWWRGEPLPSPYDCVEMHLGKWYSAPCSNYYYLSLCSSSK